MSLNRKNTSFLRFLALNTFWEGVSSKTIQYCLMIGSNIQASMFVLNRILQLLPNTSDGILTTVSSKIVTLFLVKSNMVDNAPRETLLVTHIIVWTYTVVLLCIVLIAIRQYLKNQKFSKKSKFIIMIIFQFHLCFGFSYIVIILMGSLVNPEARALLTNSSVNNKHDWILFTANILSVTFNYLIGFFIAFFSYDPFLSKNVCACHSPNFQIITFLYKVFLCPMAYLADGTEASLWILNLITIITFTVRHFYLFKSFPYYNYSTMKITVKMSTIALVIAWTNLPVLIARGHGAKLTSESILYADIVLILLSLRFWNSYFHSIIRKTLLIPNKDLKSEDQVFIKFFSLQYLIENPKIITEADNITIHDTLYYWGIFQSQKLKVETRSNKTNQPESKFPEEEIQKLTVEEFKSLNSYFCRDLQLQFMKEAIEKMNKSKKTVVLLVNFLLGSIENLPSSIFYLTKLSNSSAFEQVIISKFYEKVQQEVCSVLRPNGESEILDVRMYIDSQEVSKNFLGLISTSANVFTDYLAYYNEQNMNVITLYSKHNQIEKEDNKVQEYWTKQVESNKHIVGSLVPVYSLYLSLVRNRPVTASKILKRHQTACLQYQQNNAEMPLFGSNLNDPKILILQASMSREKLGVIRRVSPQISELLGWSVKDVVGNNVSIIMPSFMREPHHQALQKHSEKTQDISGSTKLNQVLNSYVLNRDNYVVPCEVYLSIHPYILEELMYIVIIKVRDTKDGLLLINEQGYIEASNYHIKGNLTTKPERKMHMKDICRDYLEFENIAKIHRDGSSIKSDQSHTKSLLLSKKTYHKSSTRLSSNRYNPDSFTIFLSNFAASKKRMLQQEYQCYSAILEHQQFYKTGFYVLKLSLEANNQNYDDSDSSLMMAEHELISQEDSAIPSERASEKEVVSPQLFTNLKSGNFATQKSDTYRGLLEPRRFPSAYSNFSPKFKETTENIELDDADKQTSIIRQETKVELTTYRKDKEKDMIDILKNKAEMSVASSGSYDAQIEQAVNKAPRNKSLKLIRVFGILWILSIPFTLLGIQLQKHEIASLLNGSIEFTSKATLLLSVITALNRSTRYIIVDDLALTSFLKYGMDPKYVLPPLILQFSLETNSLSNDVRRALDEIDSGLRDKAYSKTISIYDQESNSTYDINMFDFITEISSKGIRLGHTPVPQLNMTLGDVQFIVNNTLNDFLIIWEQLRQLFIEDNKLKLANQETLVIIFWVVMWVGDLLLMKVLYNVIKAFIKKRDYLLNIILRLENRPVMRHTQKVQRFIKLVEKGYVTPSIDEKINQELLEKSDVKIQHSYLTKKSIKKGMINTSLYRCYGWTIFFCGLLLSIYLVLFALTRSQNNHMSNKINVMDQSYNYFYKFSLLGAIIYEYVQENTASRVRNQPITIEISSLLTDLNGAQDFFVNTILDEKNGLTANKTLFDLVQGNLCLIYMYTDYNAFCSSAYGGIMKKGIVSLNSLILSVIGTVIANFDHSSKTFSDMFSALNSEDLNALEIIELYYMAPAYASLDTLIKNSLRDDLNSYEKTFEGINIGFAIFCVSVGLIGWVYIIMKFEKEMMQWMKMIRQVPWEILVNNKLLKIYLIKNKGISNSIQS